MKKILSLTFSVLLVSFLLSSCNCEKDFWPDSEEISPSAMLTNGPWNLDVIRTAEREGNELLTEDDSFFGPGTDNGICTFEFRNDQNCSMIDEENEEEEEFAVFADNTLMIGDTPYEIQLLTENSLELVIVEDERRGITWEERMVFSRD